MVSRTMVSEIEAAEQLQRLAVSRKAKLTARLPALSSPPLPDERRPRKIFGHMLQGGFIYMPQGEPVAGYEKYWAHGAFSSVSQVHAALGGLVNTQGQREVVAHLIRVLLNRKGNVNFSHKGNLFKEKERSDHLLQATSYNNFDMVKVIAPFADSQSLDESLSVALRQKNSKITATLLAHSAEPLWGLKWGSCESDFQDLAAEGNYEMISLFLRASKMPPTQCITESLKLAVQQGCLKSVVLLVSAGADLSHYLQYRGASALRCAVTNRKDDIVIAILAGSKRDELPPSAILDQIIASTDIDQVLVQQALLFAGARGPGVDALLCNTIQQLPLQRQYIDMLLHYGADINHDGGRCIKFAISQADIDPELVKLLLASGPSTKNLSQFFSLAMGLGRDPRRAEIVRLLISTGPKIAFKIEEALLIAVHEFPTDLALVEVLARVGQADINYAQGKALCFVVEYCDFSVLDIILRYRPDSAIISKALGKGIMLNTTHTDREAKVRKLLQNEPPQSSIDDALFVEAELLSAILDTERSLGLLKALLDATADVNARVVKSLHLSDQLRDSRILDLILNKSLSSDSLCRGLRIATSLQHAPTKLSTSQKLLAKGIDKDVVSQELISATRLNDLALCQLLIQHGASVDHQNGEAIIVATSSVSIDTLKILLKGKPIDITFRKALQKSWTLNRQARLTIIKLLFEAGMPITDPVHNCLLEAVKDNKGQLADRSLISLLVTRKASTLYKNAECLFHASKTLDFETLSLLCTAPEACSAISRVLEEVMATSDVWHSETGLKTTDFQLSQGVLMSRVRNEALVASVVWCAGSNSNISMSFLEMFLQHGADVNFNKGLALQKAAMYGSLMILQKLFAILPNSEALSMAFPYILKSKQEEGVIIQLLNAFIGAADHGRELDVNYVQPDLDLALYLALEHYPQSADILRALLRAGCIPDQEKNWTIDNSYGEETVTVLCWAICQSKEKLNDSMVEILIEAKSNPNYITSKSENTPLILAAKNDRQELAVMLLQAGAESDVTNHLGQTPLAFASGHGNVEMMNIFIESGATVNDGSLHDAARELHHDAISLLVKHKYGLDFPSERHNGRTVLGELCHRSTDAGPLPKVRPQLLEATIRMLIALGANFAHRSWSTDFSRRSSTKSILHLALDSTNPIPITRALLRTHMHKYINEDFNLFKDANGLVYSPAMYVLKGHFSGPRDQQEQLWRLLKQYGSSDTYYASKCGAVQPEDWTGAPPEIEGEERRKKMREISILEKHEEVVIELDQERLRAQQAQDLDIHHTKALARTQRKEQAAANQQFQTAYTKKKQQELNHHYNMVMADVGRGEELLRRRLEFQNQEQRLQLDFMTEKALREQAIAQARLGLEAEHTAKMKRLDGKAADQEPLLVVTDNLIHPGRIEAGPSDA